MDFKSSYCVPRAPLRTSESPVGSGEGNKDIFTPAKELCTMPETASYSGYDCLAQGCVLNGSQNAVGGFQTLQYSAVDDDPQSPR